MVNFAGCTLAKIPMLAKINACKFCTYFYLYRSIVVVLRCLSIGESGHAGQILTSEDLCQGDVRFHLRAAPFRELFLVIKWAVMCQEGALVFHYLDKIYWKNSLASFPPLGATCCLDNCRRDRYPTVPGGFIEIAV